MKRKLKIYIWRDVLCDYTCGKAMAVAYDVDEARRIVYNEYTRYPLGDPINEACQKLAEEWFPDSLLTIYDLQPIGIAQGGSA